MRFSSFSAAAAALGWALCSTPAASQTTLNSLSSVVSISAPEKVVARKNTTQPVEIVVHVKSGYHVNSTTPSDEYLIPLKLSFPDSGLLVEDVQYPKPKMQKFQFSPTPISVYEGDIKTVARVRIPSGAKSGMTHLTGKLRYQACSDRACLPPRTLDVKVPVEIRN
jgi:DsbC/DsbD-like thiol-disulfide interchange protein